MVVADAWQRRGVGAALMRALIGRAQARGVTSLAMDVLPGNRRVLAMIAGHWPEAAIGRSADGVDIRIPLSAQRRRGAVRRPARGQAIGRCHRQAARGGREAAGHARGEAAGGRREIAWGP